MKKPCFLMVLAVFPAFAFMATDLEKAHKAARISCEAKLHSYTNRKETPGSAWNLELNTNSGGRLTYVGTENSTKPDHAQFARIREAWQKTKPTLAFFEGPDRGIAANQTETIKQFGEAGLVRFLAGKAKVRMQSLEPNAKEEVQYLLNAKIFSPEQVKLFYVLRETTRLRDRTGLSGKALKWNISQFLQKSGAMFPEFKNVIPDTIALQKAYARYWNTTESWTEVPASWFDPQGQAGKNGGKFMTDLTRSSCEFRDLYMYNILSAAVQQGEKVFAVADRYHVSWQAEALKCSLKGL